MYPRKSNGKIQAANMCAIMEIKLMPSCDPGKSRKLQLAVVKKSLWLSARATSIGISLTTRGNSIYCGMESLTPALM